MSQEQTPQAPIEVKPSAVPIVTEEGAKTLIVAGCTYAFTQLIHSEQALDAILPATVVIATMLLSLWQRLRTWSVLKRLASAVSDDIAVIGKRK